MNNNAIGKLGSVVAMVMVVLYLVFDVFTAGGNAIARIYMYSMFAAGICGLLSPRKAFYLLIFLTAYLDYFKRLMIFDSGVSQLDLYYVLGIAPSMLCGIGAHVLYGSLSGGPTGRPRVAKLAVFVVAVCAVLSFLMIASEADGRARAVGNIVNGLVYLLLLFVVPALFRTPGELKRMLRSLVVIYTPAVGYMLVHGFRAWFLKLNPPIFDWELDYVLSGLTIEIRQLSERVFRPFGTFNAASNASLIFCSLIALMVGSFWRHSSNEEPSGSAKMRFLRIILVPLAALAAALTYSRTGWVLGLMAIGGGIAFRRKALTVAGYLVAGGATIAVMLAAPTMVKQNTLYRWTKLLQTMDDSDEWAQATNVATMNDRLEGYVALVQNRKIWTPFGLKISAQSEEAARSSVGKYHDFITHVLMKVGYVPLLLTALLLLYFLWTMHRYILSETDPLAKRLGATALAIALALCFGSITTAAQFVTYPVNFWIWFMFSIVVSLRMWRAEEKATAESAHLRVGTVRGRGGAPGAIVPGRVRASEVG